MILGRINEQIKDDFTVADKQGNLISGILAQDFSVHIFDPDEVVNPVTAAIQELGSGSYRISFTPNKIGMWYVIVYHSTYFKSGKAESYQVYSHSLESIGANVSHIRDIEFGRWKIVDNQMIFYKEDNITEIARFDLFDDTGTPSMESVYERVKI